jgi:hypothetical protein
MTKKKDIKHVGLAQGMGVVKACTRNMETKTMKIENEMIGDVWMDPALDPAAPTARAH